jgi:DNA-binding transcriptional MerR regulator
MEMYKISEFSRITNLTVKTLRYYDDEGILVPSHRDECNLYRYYTEEEFLKAKRIILLRELNFSIAEMKDVLSHCEQEADLSFYLEEKKTQIEEVIQKNRELIKKISLYTNPPQGEKEKMNYVTEMKEIPAMMVAAIRYKGKYSDMGKYIGTIYKAIKGNVAGVPLCLLYDDDYTEEADIEVCVPIKKEIRAQNIAVKKLAATKAICTTHEGSYDDFNLAYKTLTDYAREHKLEMKTPSRQVYIKGPGMIFRGNESKYITEILIPIEKAEK